MKLYRILLLLFLSAGVFTYTSCSDTDNGNQVNSSLRLLPVKINSEYEASSRRTYTYKYDTRNRLTEYAETSLFGNNIGLEDMETTCKITYNSRNEIDSLIIRPRLLKEFADFNNSMYELVNDTILFSYNDREITIKYKDKKDEKLTVNTKKEVISYEYFAGANAELKITNLYEYDDKGNITRIKTDNGIDSPYVPYTYAYDNRNGIFKNVNVPQWFMVIMLNQRFNMSNNYKEYTDNDGGKWIMEYSYSNDDYPVFRRMKYKGTSDIRVSDAPTTIDYMYAY